MKRMKKKRKRSLSPNHNLKNRRNKRMRKMMNSRFKPILTISTSLPMTSDTKWVSNTCRSPKRNVRPSKKHSKSSEHRGRHSLLRTSLHKTSPPPIHP